MYDDKELAEYRDLLPTPTRFEEGFDWKTIVGAVFIGFLMAEDFRTKLKESMVGRVINNTVRYSLVYGAIVVVMRVKPAIISPRSVRSG